MAFRLKDPSDLAAITALINAYANDDRTTINYTRHAEERCVERQFSHAWIEIALQRGTVVSLRAEEFRGRVINKYQVRYTDHYGNTDVVTVVPDEYVLTVITVIRDDA